MQTSVLIWDSEGPSPDHNDGYTLLWCSYKEDAGRAILSVPKLVEDNAQELRARYLAWIYELGERQHKGKRVVEHLLLRPNLSYWWMTLLAEKCNFAKSPQIDDAIRLLALEKWLAGREIRRLELVSLNRILASVLKKGCHENGIDFAWREMESNAMQAGSRTRAVFRRLPRPLQAFLWLLHRAWTRWPLRGAGVEAWRNSPAKVAFVSYLFNLVPEAAAAGRFESRYWAHLPELLRQNKIETRWLHLWVKDSVSPTAAKARCLIEQFNQNDVDTRIHVTTDSFFGLRPLWSTLKDWIRLFKMGCGLEKTLAQRAGPGFDLWPLIREDWRDSVYGQTAMSNLLMLNLFEAALASAASQDVGVYLQENQGWEFGLIGAWRACGHRTLVGTPHTMTRFWDLRHHFDPRSYERPGGAAELAIPDYVAVNGPVARKAYLEEGYPLGQLVDVEALRYLHLLNGAGRNRNAPRNGKRRLLVIGDYLAKNTATQMKLLEVCGFATMPMIDIVVKPHPNCPINPESFPAINFTVTAEPLGKLLMDCDAAYTSSVTSGAIDAYCAGVSVISVLDGGTLNLSPLRGLTTVQFISTPEELGQAIANILDGGYDANEKVNYFNLDASLPSWMMLLKSCAQK